MTGAKLMLKLGLYLAGLIEVLEGADRAAARSLYDSSQYQAPELAPELSGKVAEFILELGDRPREKALARLAVWAPAWAERLREAAAR